MVASNPNQQSDEPSAFASQDHNKLPKDNGADRGPRWRDLRLRSGSQTQSDRSSSGFPWRSRPWWVTFILLLLINYVLVSLLFPPGQGRIEVPYTFFKEQVQAGNVVEVVSRGDIIQGTFKQPTTFPATGEKARTSVEFSTVRPAFADPGLEQALIDQGVEINARPLEEPRTWWQTLLYSFAPTLLLIGAFVWIFRRTTSAGGLLGMGRSRARRYDQLNTDERVTFADVAGIDEAENELVEIVDFLRDPKKYTRLGGAAPKGVLLVGPPGTGKTLLARAVAGEAGVPFFSIGASEFVEMVVGVGASRVRDLFKQAREAAPAIIFVDELDAIGRARGGFGGASNDEREQTLNQLLAEMDGFSSREGVIVLAATNRPEVLDAALLRPGRFDRRVLVPPPDKTGREAILKIHTRNVPLGPDVDLMQVASSTTGLVGAELRNLVNEAALLAARRNKDHVSQRDFLDSLEKIVLGPERRIFIQPLERQRVAYHEAGHAILGLVVPGSDPVNRVTITPRGQALGVTYQRPEDDRYNYNEHYLRARMVGLLGGRAAEELVYGDRTTGAENDLQQVTTLARQMVTRWGMSDALGPVTLAPREGFLGQVEQPNSGHRALSEATAQLIDAEVRGIINQAYSDAMKLLQVHRQELDALAAALLERETLDEDEILAVTGLKRAPEMEGIPIAPAESGLGVEPRS